jgi:hypothetical protein
MPLDLVIQVKQLREQLIKARRDGNVELLDEVEAGLRDLGNRGYRCCLLDYEEHRASFYVRLLGYEKGRVEAELEFPIKPEMNVRQWLPLSHLADYNEAENPLNIQRIYSSVAPFIQHKSPPLQKINQNGHTRLLYERSESRAKPVRTYRRRPNLIVRNILWGVWIGLIGLTLGHICLQIWGV